jgi:hypothetical protein
VFAGDHRLTRLILPANKNPGGVFLPRSHVTAARLPHDSSW